MGWVRRRAESGRVVRQPIKWVARQPIKWFVMKIAAMDDGWVGRTVEGRYPLLRWLGGAESDGVFLTEAPDQGLRQAAIRLVLMQSGDARERAAGWQAAAGLEHPHLVRVLGTGECEVDGAAVLYCVTEYSDEVLAEVIRERALTPDEAREMLGPLVDALEYLHGHGFVHEGLRPAKIMAVNDCLKVSTEGMRRVGTPGVGGGADAYVTPEASENTTAADVWRLGVLLVEALTQRTPDWETAGGSHPAFLEGLPEPFASIARECLKGDPAKRCTLSGVRDLLAASTEAAPEPEGPSKQTQSFPAPGEIMQSGFFSRKKLLRRVDSLYSNYEFAVAPLAEDLSSLAQKMGSSKSARVALLALLALAAATGVWLVVRQPAAPVAGDHATAPVTGSVEGRSATRKAGGRMQPSAGPETKGSVVARVMPDVPEQAMQTIHGTVRFSVRLTVDAEGAVSGASIDQAGTSPYFLPFGLNAARQWRFAPAYAGGRAVPSTWVLHFALRQSGTQVLPQEVSP